jgi:hypothetical protein
MIRILKECERVSLSLIGLSLFLSHPFRMRCSLGTVPGSSATLQPLVGYEYDPHPEGMREGEPISHWALIVPLASLQDAMLFGDGSRGFRYAPTPGYLLQPLRGKELQLILKDHNRAEQIDRNSRYLNRSKHGYSRLSESDPHHQFNLTRVVCVRLPISAVRIRAPRQIHRVVL